MVLDQKRCLNCLRRSHITKNCTSKFSCYKCNGKHNPCLCDTEVKSDHGMTTTETEDSSLVAMLGRTLVAMLGRTLEALANSKKASDYKRCLCDVNKH